MRLHTTATMNIDTIMIMNILTCVVIPVSKSALLLYILWVIPITSRTGHRDPLVACASRSHPCRRFLGDKAL